MQPKEGLPSAEETYATLESDWQRLARIFPGASKPVPKVAFISKGSSHLIDGGGVREVSGDDFPPYQLMPGVGSYLSWSHTIVINGESSKKKTPSEFRMALTEEEVHAASYLTDSSIYRPPEAFRDFNAFRADFGLNVERVLNNLGFPVATMDLNEFFPPIGQSLLLGDDYPEHFDTWNIFNRTDIPSTHNARIAIASVMKHFPRLAGELLVKQYNRDIEELIHSHPDLFKSTATELWENYCVPLLTAGGVESQS